MADETQRNIRLAADAIKNADALLIGAGAGMGVDSGLPDFRGNEGFWKAYPMLHGRPFAAMANPHWFAADPAKAWGFYGHRLNLYRATVPHAGFQILRKFADRMPLGCFVFTSNVDGQFQKAGFAEDRIQECHGSIHHMQCASGCSGDIWSAEEVQVLVDEKTLEARGRLPSCPGCGGIARPNILMFGDGGWLGSRTGKQERKYDFWFNQVRRKRLVAIEMGAGTAIPSVREICEHACRSQGGTLIRINPRESHGPKGTVSISLGALEGLRLIEEAMG